MYHNFLESPGVQNKNRRKRIEDAATSTGPGTLGIIGKEGGSTVGVDKIGAGDVAGMETIAERGGAHAGALYVSVKEE